MGGKVNMSDLTKSCYRRGRQIGVIVATALAISVSARLDDKDLVDRMVLDPSLKTFTRLFARSGLVETLKSDGPFTIFAPNDLAFSKVPPAVMTSLLADKVFLRKFVSSHIVKGKVLAKDFKEGSLKSLSGEPIVFKFKGGLGLNGTKIITPDIPAANGTIHIVMAPLASVTKSK